MTLNYSHVIYTEHMQDVETVNDKNQVIFIAESLLHLAHVATCTTPVILLVSLAKTVSV